MLQAKPAVTLLLSGLILLLLVGCAGQARVKTPPAPSFEREAAVKINWRRSLGRGSRLQLHQQEPVVNDNIVYLCDAQRLLALDLRRGRREWRERFPNRLTGCTGSFATTLYFSDEKGVVYAFNPETREVLWTYELGITSVTAPTANQNVVLVQTVNERLIALRATDGSLLWSYNGYNPRLSIFGSFRPVILQDSFALTGFADGSLIFLDLARGIPLSFRQLTIPQGSSDIERLVDVDSRIVIDDDIVYLSFYGGTTAVDLRTSRELWRQPISSAQPLLLWGEKLLVIDEDDEIYALNKDTGETLWQNRNYRGRGLAAPALLRQQLIVGDKKGYVHVISTDSGLTIGRRRLGIEGINDFSYVASEGVMLIDKAGYTNFIDIRLR